MLEMLVAAFAGAVVLLGLSFLYIATVHSFGEATSHAGLQRVGTLAIETIASHAARAKSGASVDPTTCGVPVGSRYLLFSVAVGPTETNTYCYYAGSNGELCQRLLIDDTSAGTLVLSPCWNLLASNRGVGAASRPGAVAARAAGAPRQTDITLAQQPNPTSLRCPKNPTDNNGNPVAGGQEIPPGQYCLALGLSNGIPQTGDVAFSITDGLSAMTFTTSFMLQNN